MDVRGVRAVACGVLRAGDIVEQGHAAGDGQDGSWPVCPGAGAGPLAASALRCRRQGAMSGRCSGHAIAHRGRVVTAMPEPVHGPVADDGRRRLHAWLNTNLSYIEEPGGGRTPPRRMWCGSSAGRCVPAWTTRLVRTVRRARQPPRSTSRESASVLRAELARRRSRIAAKIGAKSEQTLPFAQVQLAARNLEGVGIGAVGGPRRTSAGADQHGATVGHGVHRRKGDVRRGH